MPPLKNFDLNIEKVLEDWEVFHALREIIANALDETVLSGCADIQIWQDKKHIWHILRKVIFLTPNERSYAAGLLSYARDDGFKVITVPDNVRNKLRGEVDYEGNPLRDLNEFVKQWNDSFQFNFVERYELSKKELAIFEQTKKIFEIIGGKPQEIKSVRISETMRLSKPGAAEVVGVWEEDTGRIVIKRSQLSDLSEYAGTLLHETAHALTGWPDVSEGFESGLTDLLGLSASRVVRLEQKSAHARSARQKKESAPSKSTKKKK